MTKKKETFVSGEDYTRGEELETDTEEVGEGESLGGFVPDDIGSEDVSIRVFDEALTDEQVEVLAGVYEERPEYPSELAELAKSGMVHTVTWDGYSGCFRAALYDYDRGSLIGEEYKVAGWEAPAKDEESDDE
jgi:hypothetical protein